MREVKRPQDRFRVDAALLRQALVEFFGPSGAATFLLRAYYQLDASDVELKEMILKKIEKIRDNDTASSQGSGRVFVDITTGISSAVLIADNHGHEGVPLGKERL